MFNFFLSDLLPFIKICGEPAACSPNKVPRLFANVMIRRNPDSLTYKNMKDLRGGLLEQKELTNLSVWVFLIYKIK